eukprot:1391839-Amorphochlora_amoeboformis.AAC.1
MVRAFLRENGWSRLSKVEYSQLNWLNIILNYLLGVLEGSSVRFYNVAETRRRGRSGSLGLLVRIVKASVGFSRLLSLRWTGFTVRKRFNYHRYLD